MNTNIHLNMNTRETYTHTCIDMCIHAYIYIHICVYIVYTHVFVAHSFSSLASLEGRGPSDDNLNPRKSSQTGPVGTVDLSFPSWSKVPKSSVPVVSVLKEP